MRLVPTLALALAALLAVQRAQAAAPDAFSCTYEPERGAIKLLPGNSVVTHPVGTGTYLVDDAVIRHYVGAPVEAKVLKDTARRLELTWEVRIVTTSDRAGGTAQVRLLYRLVVFRTRGNAARITARPLGYRNHSAAEGQCRIARGTI